MWRYPIVSNRYRCSGVITLLSRLQTWLESSANVGREVKVSELFEEFREIAEAENIDFGFKNASTMGRQLRQILSNLRLYFQITAVQKKRAWHYTFSPKDEDSFSQVSQGE